MSDADSGRIAAAAIRFIKRERAYHHTVWRLWGSGSFPQSGAVHCTREWDKVCRARDDLRALVEGLKCNS